MRIRSLFPACLLFVSTVACARSSPAASQGGRPSGRATAPIREDAVPSSMTGRWRGSLVYRDYGDSTRRVTLPTLLEVTHPGDGHGALLRFVYDDGPGKTVVEEDRLLAGDAPSTVTWTSGAQNVQRYAVRFRDATAVTQTVVLEGEGRDDDRPATIRQTIVADGAALRILKEVRFGSTFEFRHEYRFTRQP